MSQNVIALCVIGFFMIFPLVIGFTAKGKSSGSAEHGGVHSHSWDQTDTSTHPVHCIGLQSHGISSSESCTSE